MIAFNNFLFLFCLMGMSTSFSISWFYLSGSLSYFDFMVPLLLVIYFFSHAKIPLKFDALFVILVALCFTTGVSVLASIVTSNLPPANALYFYRSILFLAIYFLVSHWPIEKDKIITAIFIGLTLSVVISLFAWFEAPRYFGYTKIPMMHVLEPQYGIYVNRNQIGYCSSLAYVIALYALLFRQLMPRAISAPLCIFLLIFSILTFSKGAWLLIAVATFLMIILRYSLLKSLLYYLFGLVLLVLFNAIYPKLMDSILLRFENSAETNSYRLQYLKDAFDIGTSYPFFGIGPGNYEYISSLYYLKTIDPHNVFLQAYAETGALSVFLVVMLFIVSVRKGLVLHKHNHLAVCTVVMILCLFVDCLVSGLSYSSKYLYILVALMSSLYRQHLSDKYQHFRN